MAAKSSPYREMKQRRKALMAQMEPNSIALLATAPPRIRNNDAEYRYRQNSDFYYLTGFEEEDAVLALIPGANRAKWCCSARKRTRSVNSGQAG